MKVTYSVLSLATLALGFGLPAHAAIVGTDDASVYGGSWADGSDGSTNGDAFGAWGLVASTPDGGFAGHFISDSKGLDGGAGADINASGNAFGMYGNQNATATASAYRSFNGGPLSVGQTFSLDLAVNWRNGNKGFNLFDDADNEVFNFNVGSDDYFANGNSIGNVYSNNTAFNLAFTQTSAAGGTWTITRSGGETDSDSGTYTGLANRFQLYINNTDGGDQNNLFANNLSIVPEPASLALIGLGGLALLGRRRK